MTRAYLSLGSNIDREHNIAGALNALSEGFGQLVLSPVYESEAVGFDGSPFFNLVVGIDTVMPVGELAAFCHQIEADHGRVHGRKTFASRTLDIDILTHGDKTGLIDGVQLPRAEILKHAFVLQPLCDIAAEEMHPELHQTFASLLQTSHFENQSLWQIAFEWQPN